MNHKKDGIAISPHIITKQLPPPLEIYDARFLNGLGWEVVYGPFHSIDGRIPPEEKRDKDK
jgi:hypothetical protein